MTALETFRLKKDAQTQVAFLKANGWKDAQVLEKYNPFLTTKRKIRYVILADGNVLEGKYLRETGHIE